MAAYEFCFTEAAAAESLANMQATFVGSQYGFNSGKAFIKMNKANTCQMANSSGSLWFVTPDLFAETNLIVFGETPRDTWNSKDPEFTNLGDESATGYSSKTVSGSGATKGKGGTLKISLLSYLLLLLNTWQNVSPQAPKRWVDWLTTLINHYTRYTPTQIYGFLARVDFSQNTFPV